MPQPTSACETQVLTTFLRSMGMEREAKLRDEYLYAELKLKGHETGWIVSVESWNAKRLILEEKRKTAHDAYFEAVKLNKRVNAMMNSHNEKCTSCRAASL